jgi:hypothetical protein
MQEFHGLIQSAEGLEVSCCLDPASIRMAGEPRVKKQRNSLSCSMRTMMMDQGHAGDADTPAAVKGN